MPIYVLPPRGMNKLMAGIVWGIFCGSCRRVFRALASVGHFWARHVIVDLVAHGQAGEFSRLLIAGPQGLAPTPGSPTLQPTTIPRLASASPSHATLYHPGLPASSRQQTNFVAIENSSQF